LVVAAGVARRRRWAFKAARIVQVLLLLGFALSFLIGLLAVVDFSINLLTIIMNVAMPIGVIRLLRSRPDLTAKRQSRPLEETTQVAAAA
jgi:hypothetical protein